MTTCANHKMSPTKLYVRGVDATPAHIASEKSRNNMYLLLNHFRSDDEGAESTKRTTAVLWKSAERRDEVSPGFGLSHLRDSGSETQVRRFSNGTLIMEAL